MVVATLAEEVKRKRLVRKVEIKKLRAVSNLILFYTASLLYVKTGSKSIKQDYKTYQQELKKEKKKILAKTKVLKKKL